MRIVCDEKRVIVSAPAKLNLFLEVLARRADGYHDLETLMTAIDVCDTLTLEVRADSAIDLRCEWAIADGNIRQQMGDVPVGDKNIVVRTLHLLRSRAGVSCGATVHLQKRIASAAGLGGASSDAAAALLAANHAWGLNWSRMQLMAVAAELGSDIPFFLGTSAAVCRGRGELIEPISSLPCVDVVVVRPPLGLSTPQVFQRCTPANAPLSVAPLRVAWQRGRFEEVGRLMTNRLQPAAEQLCPWIAKLRDAFASQGCYGHQMSGSGSSYFGICKSAAHARTVGNRLRAGGMGFIYVTRTIGLSLEREVMRAA